jgi:hypothetical protein
LVCECCDGIPGDVPDDLFPAARLDIFVDGDVCSAGAEERREFLQSGLFERGIDSGIGEEPEFRQFGACMLDYPGGGLRGSDPDLYLPVSTLPYSTLPYP